MEYIVDKLNRISLPLSIVTEEQSRRIVSATIRKIGSLFDQYLIRVYKVDVTDDGNILDLVASLGNPYRVGNAYNRISLDSRNKKGALSWCIDYRSIFWLENIESAIDKSKLINLIDNKEIGIDYTDFSFSPDSIISIPLITKHQIIGVFSIQLPQSGIFTASALQLFESLCGELARVLRKSSEHESNISNTNQAIEDFLNEINNFEFHKDILKERYKTGFIARPFGQGFDKVGESISKYFKEKKILARHFDTNLQGGLIIEQIISQIKESHFCIADITGSNPNVLMEVGIMISENKPLRLLQHCEVNEQVPFNVGGYQIYKYKLQNLSGKMLVAYPGEDKFRDFKLMVDGFLKELEADSAFANAKIYDGD